MPPFSSTVRVHQVSLRAAALTYARAGLPVFPLQPGEKTPLVARGFYRATTNERAIMQWWDREPMANIGVPTGPPSGWIVVDVDTRHDGLVSLIHLQRAVTHHAADLHLPSIPLLATRIQQTGGGGLHLIFGWRADVANAELVLRNTTNFAGYTGLDLRGASGYIVAPPSLHASGQRYHWLHQGAIMPFPDVLVDLVWARKRAVALPPLQWQPRLRPKGTWRSLRADPAYWHDLALKHAREGSRHTYALFLARHLIDDTTLSPSQAERWVRSYAERVPQGSDPYQVNDALRCLEWAVAQRR